MPSFWKRGHWSMPFFWKRGHWPMPSFSQSQHFFRENLVSEKEGTDQCPLSEKEGIDQCPLFEKEGIQILVFYFSLYYNVNGVSMARRHWKIPSSPLGEKKNWIPHSRLRRSWEILFFCLGIWREFSNASLPYSRHYIIAQRCSIFPAVLIILNITLQISVLLSISRITQRS